MTLSLGGGGDTVTGYNFVAKHAMPGPLAFSGSIGIGPTLYVFGGPRQITPSLIRTGTVYAYDIPSDTWTVKTSMPAVLEWFSYAAIGTKIYAGPAAQPALGTPVSKALYEYDTVTGAWTTKTPLVTSDPLAFVRMCAVGTKLYVFSYDTGFHIVNTYTWDQATNIWGTDNNSGGTGSSGPAPMWAGNVNGQVYVIGSPSVYNGTNQTLRFDPASHVWARMANPPFGAVAGEVQEDGVGVVVGTDIYILTLVDFVDTTFITGLYRYETLTNTWTTVVGRLPNHGITQMPPTSSATGVNLGVGANGRLYFSGGFHTGTLVALSLHWEMTLPGIAGDLVLGGLALG